MEYVLAIHPRVKVPMTPPNCSINDLKDIGVDLCWLGTCLRRHRVLNVTLGLLRSKLNPCRTVRQNIKNSNRGCRAYKQVYKPLFKYEPKVT